MSRRAPFPLQCASDPNGLSLWWIPSGLWSLLTTVGERGDVMLVLHVGTCVAEVGQTECICSGRDQLVITVRWFTHPWLITDQHVDAFDQIA